jgi:hypothetical protein
MEGKRTKEAEGPLIAESNRLGGNFSFKGKVTFVKERYLNIYLEMKCSPRLKKKLIRSMRKCRNLKSPLK